MTWQRCRAMRAFVFVSERRLWLAISVHYPGAPHERPFPSDALCLVLVLRGRRRSAGSGGQSDDPWRRFLLSQCLELAPALRPEIMSCPKRASLWPWGFAEVQCGLVGCRIHAHVLSWSTVSDAAGFRDMFEGGRRWWRIVLRSSPTRAFCFGRTSESSWWLHYVGVVDKEQRITMSNLPPFPWRARLDSPCFFVL